MLKDMMFRLKEELNQYQIMLSFTGPFSQGIIEEIGTALKTYLKNKDNNTKGDVYKVFSIFIEQMQNVNNYAVKFKGEEKERISSSGVLMIGEVDDEYFICSGNLLKKEDQQKLKTKLDKVKSLDDKELAKEYRKKLREDMRSKDGGAGLGLYEIAKQAKRKLEYNFIEQDEDYNFFTLTVYI